MLFLVAHTLHLFMLFVQSNATSNPTQNRSNFVNTCSMAVLEGAFQGRCASQVSPLYVHVTDLLRSLRFHVVWFFSTRSQMRR